MYECLKEIPVDGSLTQDGITILDDGRVEELISFGTTGSLFGSFVVRWCLTCACLASYVGWKRVDLCLSEPATHPTLQCGGENVRPA